MIVCKIDERTRSAHTHTHTLRICVYALLKPATLGGRSGSRTHRRTVPLRAFGLEDARTSALEGLRRADVYALIDARADTRTLAEHRAGLTHARTDRKRASWRARYLNRCLISAGPRSGQTRARARSLAQQFPSGAPMGDLLRRPELAARGLQLAARRYRAAAAGCAWAAGLRERARTTGQPR